MNKLTRRLVAAMLLGVVVYFVIGVSRGLDKIAAELDHFAWWTFAAACGLAFGNYVLRFLKWEYYLSVLRIRGVPKGESFLTFLSGFVLTVTPGKVGEVFKSVILNELHAVPIARTAPIVVAERVTDLIGVITMIVIGSLNFPGGAIWAGLGSLAVVALLVFVASKSLSEGFLGLLPKLPGPLGRVGAKVAPKVGVALASTRELTTPGRLAWPTLLSIGAWALEGLGLWLILRGFSASIPVTLTMFCYATATLAGALIPLPGGLGVVEKLLDTQMVGLGGVAGPVASAAMILIRFATLWFAVGVGFLALGLLRARRPGLMSGATDLNASPATD